MKLDISKSVIIDSKLLINRNAIREAEREFVKLSKIVFKIETMMTDLIFESNLSYKDAYDKMLEFFVSNIQYVELIIKPKYCSINKEYFVNNYKPVENSIRNNSFLLRKFRIFNN